MDRDHLNIAIEPPPLRIARFGDIMSQSPTNTPRSISRTINHSMEPIPHLPADKPLAVLKKRRHGTSQTHSSECSEEKSGRRTPSLFTPKSSSNYNEVLRSRTPKFFNKLRSLSSNRAISAKATGRAASSHNLESSASPGCPPFLLPETPESEGGSSTEASYDPEPFMPLGYDGFRRHSSRQAGSPPSAVAKSSDHGLDAYLLVPQISITPDVKRVGENGPMMV